MLTQLLLATILSSVFYTTLLSTIEDNRWSNSSMNTESILAQNQTTSPEKPIPFYIQINESNFEVLENKVSRQLVAEISVVSERNSRGINCYLNDTGYLNLESNYQFNNTNNGRQERIFHLWKTSENPFDRENTPVHSVEIHCNDSGQPPVNVTSQVTITILDENDNSPMFTNPGYKFAIFENAFVGSTVGNVVANDKDLNENGLVSYSIIEKRENQGTFKITSDGQIQLKGSLDREKISVYELVAVAKDGGNKPLSSTSPVVVTVMDVNDNQPKFQKPLYEFSISENANIGDNVGNIVAEDLDLDDNSKITFSIVDNSQSKGTFLINKYGHILLNKFIDREIISNYWLMVIATDMGRPALTGTCQIRIKVLDENDNAPRFLNKVESFSISEGAKIGDRVGKVTAFDTDLPGYNVILYSLDDNGFREGVFTVDNHGYITLKRTIDREEKDFYEFSVVVKDKHKPKLTGSCKITVKILDVNDNAPVITNMKSRFQIVESWNQTFQNLNIGKLVARDLDLGNNAIVRYRLKSISPPWIQMLINNQGQISIQGIIDRENVSLIKSNVEVMDSGSPSFTVLTTIYIDVLDLNDNSPEFLLKTQSHKRFIDVNLDLAANQSLTQVTATDPDKGVNGSVVYSLNGTEYLLKIFSIDKHGNIFLREKIDRELILSTLLIVEARDQGSPPLKNMALFHLRFINPTKQPSYSIIRIVGFTTGMILLLSFVAAVAYFGMKSQF